MKAELTCPECGHRQEEKVPEKACLQFYKCEGCNGLIKAKEECCVVCEYSDIKCPVNIS